MPGNGIEGDWASFSERFSGKTLARRVKADRAAARKPRADRPRGRPREQGEIPVPPADMAARLYRAFAGQMDRLEARLNELMAAAEAGDIQEIDRTVKTLASLARTLTVLMELETGKTEAADDGTADDGAALREALARRLELLGRQRPD